MAQCCTVYLCWSPALVPLGVQAVPQPMMGASILDPGRCLPIPNQILATFLHGKRLSIDGGFGTSVDSHNPGQFSAQIISCYLLHCGAQIVREL